MFRAAVFHVKHCRLFCGAGCACTDFVGTRRAVSADFMRQKVDRIKAPLKGELAVRSTD